MPIITIASIGLAYSRLSAQHQEAIGECDIELCIYQQSDYKPYTDDDVLDMNGEWLVYIWQIVMYTSPTTRDGHKTASGSLKSGPPPE